jgi:hypothetical protein
MTGESTNRMGCAEFEGLLAEAVEGRLSPAQDAPLRHVEFVPLSPGEVLAVLVSADGTVENRLMTAPPGLPAAALDVCVAPDVGLQVDWDARVSGENLSDAGLVRTGDVWQTPGYETAAVQTHLRVSSNASSLTVHRTGGCP